MLDVDNRLEYARLCVLTGLYHCTTCHTDRGHVVPWAVFTRADFSLHQVAPRVPCRVRDTPLTPGLQRVLQLSVGARERPAAELQAFCTNRVLLCCVVILRALVFCRLLLPKSLAEACDRVVLRGLLTTRHVLINSSALLITHTTLSCLSCP